MQSLDSSSHFIFELTKFTVEDQSNICSAVKLIGYYFFVG